MKIWGVTGWKNSGKTGLMERLVAEFTARGLSVSTVKRTHHALDLDRPGSDTFRHRQAGAAQVLLASDARAVLMSEHREEAPPLEALLAQMAPVDLILIEGYKSAPHPKIECHRTETGQPLLDPAAHHIRAIASNAAPAPQLLRFDLNDTAAIADFITAELAL